MSHKRRGLSYNKGETNFKQSDNQMTKLDIQPKKQLGTTLTVIDNGGGKDSIAELDLLIQSLSRRISLQSMIVDNEQNTLSRLRRQLDKLNDQKRLDRPEGSLMHIPQFGFIPHINHTTAT